MGEWFAIVEFKVSVQFVADVVEVRCAVVGAEEVINVNRYDDDLLVLMYVCDDFEKTRFVGALCEADG